MQVVSYVRVSTSGQGESGLGLEAQRASILEWSERHGHEIIEEVVEVDSGKNDARREIARAIEICKERNATLVAAKIDRLARSVRYISNVMSQVNFVALDQPISTDAASSRLIGHILSSFAEFESRKNSQRTKDALAVVAKTKKLGSPTPSNGGQVAAAILKKKAELNAMRVMPYIRQLEARGIVSAGQIAKELTLWRVAIKIDKDGNEVKPCPNRGPRWHPQQVINIRNRAASAATLDGKAEH